MASLSPVLAVPALLINPPHLPEHLLSQIPDADLVGVFNAQLLVQFFREAVLLVHKLLRLINIEAPDGGLVNPIAADPGCPLSYVSDAPPDVELRFVSKGLPLVQGLLQLALTCLAGYDLVRAR